MSWSRSDSEVTGHELDDHHI